MLTVLAVYAASTLALLAGVRLVERRVDSRWIGVPLIVLSLAYFLALFWATGLFREVLT